MLLFRSEDHRKRDRQEQDHIDRWCKAWRLLRGETLTIDQAWKLADGWYRNRMSPAWRRRPVEEAHELFRSLGLTSNFWRFS